MKATTWLRVNDDSVYGTRPGPVQGLDWCRSTRRGNTVYLHVFDWPADGVVRLPAELGPVRSARLLADGSSLPIAGGAAQGPTSAPDPVDTVLNLET